MSDTLALSGLILVIVGLTHLDDASAGHVRVGYVAAATGFLLVVLAAAVYIARGDE